MGMQWGKVMDEETRLVRDLYNGMAEMDCIIDDMKAAIEKMAMGKKTAEKMRGHVRDEIFRIMQERIQRDGDITPIRFEGRMVYLSDKAPSVVIPDEDKIPEEFLRMKVEPNRKKISAYLKDNNRPDWACYSDHEYQLNIRV